MCRDLKTLGTGEVRVGLKEAWVAYQKTMPGTEAERFSVTALKSWVDELDERLHAAKPEPKGRVYVAGPMRGYPEFNFPAFKRAAVELRVLGYEVFSPAENDLNKGFDPKEGTGFAPTGETTAALRSALADDTKWICEKATHIYMLRGWEKSTGATAEHALAKALGLHIMYEGDE